MTNAEILPLGVMLVIDHISNRSYFVDQSERTSKARKSNRGEEHLALALWRASQTAPPITLPGGMALEAPDYQVPLKLTCLAYMLL